MIMEHIKTIKTEQVYEDTLVQIEKLWEAAPNTTEGDLLDILLLLVKDYEKKHYPIPQLDPIEAIKYEMEERGLNQASLAKRFGVSKGVVSEVLSRKKPLSLNFIKFLYKDLGIPPQILLA